jgi:hypothetical protein
MTSAPKVVFRTKAGGRVGQTLYELRDALLAEGHDPFAPCAVVVPGDSETVALAAVTLSRLALARRHDPSWWRADVAMAIANEQDDRDYMHAILGAR